MSAETHTQDSYNHSGFIVFLLSMVVSVGFFIAVLVLHHGVDLKEVYEPKAAPTAAKAPGVPDAATTAPATAGVPAAAGQPENK